MIVTKLNTMPAAVLAALALCASTALADTWTTSNAGKITTQNSTTKLGVGLTGNANVRGWLDVEGNAVIGAGYSGNSTVTPPSNGLLVEGNVGLGVTSGLVGKLDVNGLLNVRNRLTLTGTSGTNPSLSVLHTSTTGSIVQFLSGASPGNVVGEITADGNAYLRAVTVTDGNLNVRFGMYAEGDGGVGGSFNVAGGLNANEIHSNTRITVGTAGLAAPDYVFEDSYKPMSLKDVERYIKTHKHLPEIPPGKEIESKGIDVAAMNLLLLKKVEELTLHAIEQDKKIQALIHGNR